MAWEAPLMSDGVMGNYAPLPMSIHRNWSVKPLDVFP